MRKAPNNCSHDNVIREVIAGHKTGELLCVDCDDCFTNSQKLEEARDDFQESKEESKGSGSQRGQGELFSILIEHDFLRGGH